MSTSTLKRSTAQADGVAQGVTSDEPADLVALRRRTRLLEQKTEILWRAAADFAKDSLPK